MVVLTLIFAFWFIRPIKIMPSLTENDVEKIYSKEPSFTQFLPYVDYDKDSECFLLEDGVSVGKMLSINMLPTEARPQEYLAEIEENFRNVINHSIPQLDNPYIVQSYCSDQNDLDSFIKDYEDYYPDKVKESKFTNNFLSHMKTHLKNICNPNGYFIDNTVSGGPWSAKQRFVYIFIYKRLDKNEITQTEKKQKREYENGNLYEPAKQLNDVTSKFTTQLKSCGIEAKVCNESDLVSWLIRWFNPLRYKLITNNQFNNDEGKKPYGFDLSNLLNLSEPISDQKTGNWYFEKDEAGNNIFPSRVISINSLSRAPKYGHLSGERKIGDLSFAFLDKLPIGCTINTTIIIQAQDFVQNHLMNLQVAAKGLTAESQLTGVDAQEALYQIQQGDNLYPCMISVIVTAKDDNELERKLEEIHALLISQGLMTVAEKNTLIPLDVYKRNLPMVYEPKKDKIFPLSRYMFSSHIARLLPWWGRSRGTGNHGLIFYNRGAEPISFDPLNSNDRSANAFGFFVGPPGSGKSAILVYLLMQFIAIYNVRVFIIEKGGSFRLLGEHCKRMGLSVNSVTLQEKYNISLPPFYNALIMLEKEEKKKKSLEKAREIIEKDIDDFVDDIDHHLSDFNQSNDEDHEEADLLGEMELLAFIMITGGDSIEEAKISRADRLLIRNAIFNAAIKKRQLISSAIEKGKKLNPDEQTVRTIDVVEALRDIGSEQDRRESSRVRAQDMSDALELFCSGTLGHFFNRGGYLWPDSDMTIMELGVFSQESYSDGLSVAFISLMNVISNVAERDQYLKRPIIMVGDECHFFFDKPRLIILFIKVVKTFRKLGVWPLLGTQNFEDCSGEAKKMLSMIEWFYCMTCPREQAELVSDFKDLTEEQKSLVVSAQKESGHYTEGVVISKKITALFRNVPPPIALALAQTEKHEKALRFQIAKEIDGDELDAAYTVAERMSGESK